MEHARPRASRAGTPPDSKWRNRDEFFEGREEMAAFFKRKWARGLDYRLMKELWCYQGNWISAHFEYESRDEGGQWWRSHLYDWIATPSLRLRVVLHGASSRRSHRSGAAQAHATLIIKGNAA